MLTTTPETIGICLFGLPEKDQAVIQRVVTFGASQGKHYALQPAIDCAQIIIASDNTALPGNTALVIRIGDDDSLPCDLVLARPLLVTRVMRTLDDAAHTLKTRPKSEAAPQQAAPTPEPIAEDVAAEPQAEVETAPSEAVAVAAPPEVPASTPTETITEETVVAIIAPPKPEPIAEPEASTEETPPPAPVTEAETPTAAPETPAEVPAEAHYTYTALVVDDSAAIRKQLEIELRNAQIKAEFAETGEEALEKSGQKQYDLVFLDIIMPGIDGYEVCRQMRSRKTMKKTPIIMLSGKTSPLDEVQGVIAGASTYLTKPVKHEQFQETLKRVSKWLTNFAR
ncbi:MAG: response regulator [Thiothrix sp.]|uniref:response regulator n=1 Tax=Thiothrix sp. TaxID=1032 RepID=UPI002614DF46|nr:response regulator [Thiothrix sp.]MDD5392172.1 response regulator [Thiothrix sp.]